MTNLQKNSNVRMLACLLDGDDIMESDYRFLVNGSLAKYVKTAPGTFLCDPEDRAFEPVLLGNLFPQFPPGNWNNGHVARDPATGEPSFVKTEIVQFPARLRQGVRVSTHPGVNAGRPVLVKFAVWPWEVSYAEAETTAYEWLQNVEVVPKFLGFVTEGKDGRVIGFVTEFIEGARPAEPRDIEGCEKALKKLHELGIKMGDTNKFNFLVRDGHDVMIADLEAAEQGCSQDELQEEMKGLKACLEDTSFLGGQYTVEE
ncbi:kinase-like domain-containing protein [Fusarium mexicanum]|uniref:Kinase-like domain-containing protein n=1 Tax=Fusarium mexicanum TaxID=751941 RepID=A0A8H5MYI8_9HYPO|nr:kinase-like domain-containing protein [Fusarium mexicanum]